MKKKVVDPMKILKVLIEKLEGDDIMGPIAEDFKICVAYTTKCSSGCNVKEFKDLNSLDLYCGRK